MSRHLTILLRNMPGEFFRVLERLRQEGVRMLAFHLASTGPKSGYIQLVCDDHHKALTILATQFQHYVQESEVILLRLHTDCGDLVPLLSDLASQGINIENSYQTLDGDGNTLVVLEASNAEQSDRARVAATKHACIELLSGV